MTKNNRPAGWSRQPRAEGKCSLPERTFASKIPENSQDRLASYRVDAELVVHPESWEARS